MKIIKKAFLVILIILIFLMIFNNDKNQTIDLEADSSVVDANNVFDEIVTNSYLDKGMPDSDDEIWAIIKLEMPSILEYAIEDGFDNDLNAYLNTETGISNLNAIIDQQEQVKKILIEKFDVTFKYSYFSVTNGFAVKIKYGDYDELFSIEGIEEVIYSVDYLRPTTEDKTEYVVDNATLLGAKTNSDYLGEGMLIGIVDTGLQTTHEAFNVIPNSQKLEKDEVNNLFKKTIANNYMKDNLSIDDVYLSGKIPFAYDYADVDSDVNPNLDLIEESGNDHGTHVAGIACGNNGVDFYGAAPNAQLAVFKVFSETTAGASTVDIIAALNDAIILGVDVINMSLGSPCGFSIESNGLGYQEMCDAVYDAGISLVCAAGNQYSAGYGTDYRYGTVSWLDQSTISSPSSYDSSLSVASFDTENERYQVFIADDLYIRFNNAVIDSKTSEKNNFVNEVLGEGVNEKKFSIVEVGLATKEECENASLDGKIALVKRGSISFTEKVINAQNAGAIAVIIYNNVNAGQINAVVEGAKIPSCSITLEDAKKLINNNCKEITIKKDLIVESKSISDFSSWGPGNDLSLKPEITSYGGSIYSSIPSDSGSDYGLMSGTSMASPNMAGNVAIIRQYLTNKFYNLDVDNKTVSDMAYRLLMSTATPIINPKNGKLYSPRIQGAGLINIDNALNTPCYLYVKNNSKPKLELGDDDLKTGIYKMSFNVLNMSDSNVSYELDVAVLTTMLARDGYSLEEESLVINDCKIKIYVNEDKNIDDKIIELKPYEELEINVEITLSDTTKELLNCNYPYGTYIEGYIMLNAVNLNVADLSIPYLTYFGDWGNSPIFDGNIFDEDNIAFKTALYALIKKGTKVVEMGTYIHELKDGMDAPKITNQHLSLSTKDNEGCYAVYGIYLGLLRNARKISYEVYDAETNEYLEGTYEEDVRKSHYDFNSSMYAPVFKKIMLTPKYANNAHLKLVITAYLDDESYTNTKYQYVYDLYIDNEKPAILEENDGIKHIVEGDKHYLEFSVYDNHFLQSFCLYDSMFNNLTGNIPFNSELGTNYFVKYEITDLIEKLPDDKIILYVDDYALNTTTYDLELKINEVSMINFENDKYEIMCNESVTLKYVVEPLNGYLNDESIEITVEDESIARINSDFTIIGLKEGTTNVILTAKTIDDKEISCMAVIDVKEANAYYLNLKLENTDIYVDDNMSFIIDSNIPDVNLKTKTWSSSDENIALVDNFGNVELKKSGVVKISLTIENYYCEYTLIIKEKNTEFIIVGNNLLKYIGTNTDVVIPDYIVNIGENAFKDTNIKSILIPKSVIEIGSGCFENCVFLEKIYLESTQAIKWNVSNINGSKVFKGCSDVEIVAEENTYYNSSSDGIIYSNNYQVIEYVFEEMINNSDYVMKPSVKKAVAYAFAEIKFKSFSFNDSFEKITDYLFYGSSVLELKIVNNINEIGEYAFAYSNIEKIVFDNNLKMKIENYAFYATAATTIMLPEGLKEISYKAFADAVNLKNIYLPKTLVKISSYAFMNTNLTNDLVLPDNIVILEEGAFKNCKNLTSVYLPLSLREFNGNIDLSNGVKEQTFAGCDNLETYSISQNNHYYKTIDGVLYNKAGTILYAYPNAKTDSYYYVLEGTKKIFKDAFKNNLFLEKVELPKSLRVIGDSAFYGCQNLSEVIFLSKNAPVLEQIEIINGVNNYSNFKEGIYNLEMLQYEQVKGLRMVICGYCNGFESLPYQMFFSDFELLDVDKILTFESFEIEQKDDKIILSWDKSKYDITYHIYRKNETDEFIYLASTKDFEFVDETAFAVCCFYTYKIVVEYEINDSLYNKESKIIEIYKNPTKKQQYYEQISNDIDYVISNKDLSIVDLLEALYKIYKELSEDERRFVSSIRWESLKEEYLLYVSAKSFDDVVNNVYKPYDYSELEKIVKELEKLYSAMQFEAKKYVAGFSFFEELQQDLVVVEDFKTSLDLLNDVTLDSKDTIDLIKNKYDKLTDYQQMIISDLYVTKITIAEEKYTRHYRAQVVIDLILSLPEKPNGSDKNAIQIARNSYNNLLDEEKVLVPNEVLSKLERLENEVPETGCTVNFGSTFVMIMSSISLLFVLFKKKN